MNNREQRLAREDRIIGNIRRQQAAALSREEKRLLRLYEQLPLEDLQEKALRFGEMYRRVVSQHPEPNQNNYERELAEYEKRSAEYRKQTDLYMMAYNMKRLGIPFPRNGGKTRRQSKSKKTRRLRR